MTPILAALNNQHDYLTVSGGQESEAVERYGSDSVSREAAVKVSARTPII